MKIFSYFKSRGVWWFRLLGRGVSVKDTKAYPLLFSERNGFVKRIQIGKWSIKYLPKYFDI
jgi:hypothetical protein